MSASKHRTQTILSLIKEKYSIPELLKRQEPKPDEPFPPSIRSGKAISRTSLENYWKILLKQTEANEIDKASYRNLIPKLRRTCHLPWIAGLIWPD